MNAKSGIVLFIFSFIFSLFPVNAQPLYPFTLVVKCDDESIKELSIGESYFFKEYTAAKLQNNKTTRTGDSFVFSGNLLYPTAIRVYATESSSAVNHLLFIDSGYQEICIYMSGVSSKMVVNKPGKIEQEHKKFLFQTGIDSMDGGIQLSKFENYVKDNPGSYVALFKFLFDITIKGYLRKQQMTIGGLFNDRIRQSKGFKAYGSDYLFQKTIRRLTVRDSDGKKVKLSLINSDSRYTLLEFWYTGCVYCPKSMAEIKKALSEGLSERVRVVSICTDENNISSESKTLLEKIGITWMNFWDLGAGESGRYFSHLKFSEEQTVYPSNVLLDNKGRVIARMIDPEYLYEFFE
jgi:cytochrome oxidase Cu insertion factor (SCO1/SenC/PrrC family)